MVWTVVTYSSATNSATVEAETAESSRRSVGGRGAVNLEGDTLIVRFSFSKARFDEIRRLRGARYDKINKCWKLPVNLLPTLQQSRLFNSKVLSYTFSEEEGQLRALAHEKKVDAQQKQIKSNPYFVHEQDIVAADVEIAFFLARDRRSIRAKVKPFSRLKKRLEAIAGVHYLNHERLYYFPTAALSNLLKDLKAEDYLFAVEKELGELLHKTAGLRREILDRVRPATGLELRTALLGPVLDLQNDEQGSFYKLYDWTAEQLRQCLPHCSTFKERTARSQRLTRAECYRLIFNAHNAGLQLWLGQEINLELEEQQSAILSEIRSAQETGFRDELLALTDLDNYWSLNAAGRIQLKLSDNLLTPEIEQTLRDCLLNKMPAGEQASFYVLKDSRALQAYHYLTHILGQAELQIPRTQGFSRYLQELARRAELRAQTSALCSQRDALLTLQDQALQAKLFPHQKVAVQWLLSQNSGFLGDDMGLGKTLSMLTAFQELQQRGEVDLLLVICPNSLVRNWLREVEQWTPGLKAAFCPKGKAKREAALKQLAKKTDPTNVFILNFEQARLPTVFPKLLQALKLHRTVFCIDESQRVKNPASKTFEALKELAPACQRRILMSGTPTPRDIADIWAQMYLLDQGERFGNNYFLWLEQIAELGNKWSEYAVKRFVPEQVTEVISRVQEVLLRRKKEEVVDLPEKLFSVRDIELTGSQQKLYDQVCEELLLQVSKVNGDVYLRQIDSLLEEYLRAVQIASNPRLVDEQWVGTPAKFAELDEIVNEVVVEQGGKLVIWTNYLKNIDELMLRYKDQGALEFSGRIPDQRRADSIKEFQDSSSSARVMIAIPAAGGVGITLTAARTVVYLDKTWNAEHFMQSVDRVHRIGQTGTVNVISLSACKVDELIGINLWRKHKAQEQLLKNEANGENLNYPSYAELRAALLT